MNNEKNKQVSYEEAMAALQMLQRELNYSEETIVEALFLAKENQSFLEEAIVALYRKKPSEDEFLAIMESMEEQET